MSASDINLIIEKNSDFEVILTIEDVDTGLPINLNNKSIASKFKYNYQTSSSVSFNAEIVDGARGKIKLSLPFSVCSGLAAKRYVYDLVMNDNTTGQKTRLTEGIVLVKEQVTPSTVSGVSPGSGPIQTSENRTCIAIIDENSNISVDGMESLWSVFRQNWPDRKFFLLQPGGYSNSIDDLAVPANFLEETDPDKISYP